MTAFAYIQTFDDVVNWINPMTGVGLEADVRERTVQILKSPFFRILLMGVPNFRTKHRHAFYRVFSFLCYDPGVDATITCDKRTC